LKNPYAAELYLVHITDTACYYNQGFKRCVECEIFVEWVGMRCPCCDRILRIKPHNNVSKGKLLQGLNYIWGNNHLQALRASLDFIAIKYTRLNNKRILLAIALDQVIVGNTLLAVIIVGSIYLERWLEEKARRRKERETKKITINFIMNDLENKLHFIEESRQYKDYKPFSTDMWDTVILTGRHSLLSFELFEDLQHTYSWMKYYNTELDVNKSLVIPSTALGSISSFKFTLQTKGNQYGLATNHTNLT
jgi:hypothetical protein